MKAYAVSVCKFHMDFSPSALLFYPQKGPCTDLKEMQSVCGGGYGEPGGRPAPVMWEDARAEAAGFM